MEIIATGFKCKALQIDDITYIELQGIVNKLYKDYRANQSELVGEYILQLVDQLEQFG